VTPEPKVTPKYIGLVDEKMLAGIGRVVTQWAFGEAVLEDMLAGLLQAEPKHVYALTANLPTQTKIESIRAVARMRMTTMVFDTFETMLDDFRVLAPFRNKVAHGLWSETTDPEIAQVDAIKSGGKVKFQSEYQNVYYLDWLHKEITRSSMTLFYFSRKHELIPR
jgi:hypothetical protein